MIKEEIYPWAKSTFTDVVEQITNCPDAEQGRLAEKLLSEHNFLSNYVLTKNLSEHMLQQQRGDLRRVIIRPSAVYCCAKEPIPGWCDVATAAGHVTFPMINGWSKNFLLPDWFIGELVPCDLFCNAVLVTAAHSGSTPKPELNVYHSSSSVKSQWLLKDFYEDSFDYVKFNRLETELREPKWSYVGDLD